MKLSSLLVLLFSFAFVQQTAAQKSFQNKEGYYEHEMKLLQKAIQKNFYDSSSGYYKEVVSPKPGDNPYCYLWPLCTLYQAANEMETFDARINFMQPLFTVIKDYYDPSAPAPGYASYNMKLKGGDRFYDDNQWIGIAAMDAYTRTGKEDFLHTGKEIYRYMMTGFDTVLNGGLYWQENKKTSKNTCSNGPGIILAMQLYKATKNKTYLDTALLLYNWVNANLKNSSGLYYDNIGIKNKRIGKAVFSYNTGTMLQSNLYLYESTHDEKYLKEAAAIADSSLVFFYSGQTFRDNYWFNAVLLRAYQHLLLYNKDRKYILGFKHCLDHVLQQNKTAKGLFRKEHVLELVEQGGMLEILARFALLERQQLLK